MANALSQVRHFIAYVRLNGFTLPWVHKAVNPTVHLAAREGSVWRKLKACSFLIIIAISANHGSHSAERGADGGAADPGHCPRRLTGLLEFGW